MNAIIKTERQDGLHLMQEEDLPDVIKIENKVYPFPWTKGIFHDCLHIGYCCWILQQEGKVVGYSVMSVAVGEAHLLTIVVDTDEQGKGYGKQLLTHMLDLAVSHNAEMMYLEVRKSNHNAIGLYQQYGFNELGIRNNYYPAENGREDALIMALDLSVLKK